MRRKIICIVILSIVLNAVPVASYAETTEKRTEETSETYDEGTNTKTTIKKVTLEVVETEEEIFEDAPADHEPARELTTYDKYKDFDSLMKKERGSQYVFSQKHTVYVTADTEAAELRISIHHTGDDLADEFLVYDEDGNLVETDVEYLPGEMVFTLRNVRKGERFTVNAKVGKMDGVYVTQTSSNEYYYEGWKDTSIPEFDAFGTYNYSEEVYRSLKKRDNITAAELNSLLKTYPLIPNGSLLKKDGVADAFIRVQNEFGISALGLLAIACLESAYGTSRIAVNKQNLFGWGAVDSSPYNGAWDWSNIPTSEAIYKALKLICINYPLGEYEQDCYYRMRWNNNVHQYCTSTTWPNSNARIRAQLETYMGLR